MIVVVINLDKCRVREIGNGDMEPTFAFECIDTVPIASLLWVFNLLRFVLSFRVLCTVIHIASGGAG